MAKLNALKSDVATEAGGVWVHYLAGVELLIARLGHPTYRAYIEKHSRIHRRLIRSETDEGRAKLDDIVRWAVSKFVLIGWRNIEDDDGQPIEYSAQAAYGFLGQEELRDLYDFVVEFAKERQNYNDEADEAGLKN